MTNIEFKKWLNFDNIKTFSNEYFEQLMISNDLKEFLLQYGFPNEVGMLNFDYFDNPLELVKVNNKAFYKIGFNGNGDFILIENVSGGKLIILNHDNFVEEFFINSSIIQFSIVAELIFEFESKLTKYNKDSFYDTEFSDNDLENLKTKIVTVDATIFKIENSYWKDYLENLIYERDEERNSF